MICSNAQFRAFLFQRAYMAHLGGPIRRFHHPFGLQRIAGPLHHSTTMKTNGLILIATVCRWLPCKGACLRRAPGVDDCDQLDTDDEFERLDQLDKTSTVTMRTVSDSGLRFRRREIENCRLQTNATRGQLTATERFCRRQFDLEKLERTERLRCDQVRLGGPMMVARCTWLGQRRKLPCTKIDARGINDI